MYSAVLYQNLITIINLPNISVNTNWILPYLFKICWQYYEIASVLAPFSTQPFLCIKRQITLIARLFRGHPMFVCFKYAIFFNLVSQKLDIEGELLFPL